MWGSRPNAKLYQTLHSLRMKRTTYGFDQDFLRDIWWPIIKQDVFIAVCSPENCKKDEQCKILQPLQHDEYYIGEKVELSL